MARQSIILSITSGHWVQDYGALEAIVELDCGHTITTTWTALYKGTRRKTQIPCTLCAEIKKRTKKSIAYNHQKEKGPR